MTNAKYLAETTYFNFSHKKINPLIKDLAKANISPTEKAIRLYHNIRDGYRYNPYRISFRPEKYIASNLVDDPEGHCIDKSILLITGLRALGIPARLRLAKVKNHIGVERLVEKFGTNVMTPHGMADIYLNSKWVKASPAFNRELCKKCNVAPLDFDGKTDAVFQEYDQAGGQFMDYLEDYGSFEDVPLEFIINNMKEHYPAIIQKYTKLQSTTDVNLDVDFSDL